MSAQIEKAVNATLPPAVGEPQMDPLAVAKVPRQQRARDRFEAVLKESESVLENEGLAGFSIPVVAERLGMTRGSVYAYFPTPYAVLNELVQRYLSDLENLYIEHAYELEGNTWWNAIEWAMDQAAIFHNERPAARLLILGGAVSDSSYRSLESLLKRLGSLTSGVWLNHAKGRGPRGQLPPDVDVFTLAIDIGLACFRRSFFEHGEIRPEYKDAAVHAMRSFLQSYLEPAADRAA